MMYSDSDMAGDQKLNARSQTGIMILLNGAPVYWRSVRQPSTALRSACADIYALSDAVRHARLLNWRSEEMGMTPCKPLVVQVDNLQAKSFAEGTCVNSRLRGTFNVRDEWVMELKDRHELTVEHVSTVNNCADLLTKVHKTIGYQQLLGLTGTRLQRRMVQERAMFARMQLIQMAAA